MSGRNDGQGDGMVAEFETVRLSVGDMHKEREAAPVTVVLYHSGGSTTASLREGSTLEIGRVPPCDVVLPDESLSRRHARVRLLQGNLFVEDLRSTNGTKVNERPVEEETPVGVNDLVMLGSVMLRFSTAPGARDEGHLESYDQFRQHVDDEVVRSKHFSRVAGVIALRASEPGKHVATVAPLVQPLLTPVARVALYSRDVLLVLVPETHEEQIGVLAAALTAKDKRPRLLVGTASYPASAATADELIDAARSALRKATVDAPVQSATSGARRLLPEKQRSERIVKSPQMVALYETIQRLHRSTIPVLLHGETGSGKEVVARAIHEGGPRVDKPLVSVNCGAIPRELVESTILGHEKGSFTNAHSQQKGIFEAADGGTVFLDEIGELSLDAQVKLLRVLETRKVARIGSTKEIDVDVRVVAASHKDLEQMVAAGTFREDLLFRLNAITLSIPPLRERKDEIAPLAERFLDEAAQLAGRPMPRLSDDAWEIVLAYPWPGNVRELKNAMERAAVIAPGDVIGSDDLPDRVRRFASPPAMKAAAASSSASAVGPVTVDGSRDLKTLVRGYETRVIEEALAFTRGNQTEAAKLLQIPLRTLVFKIKALGVNKAPRVGA